MKLPHPEPLSSATYSAVELSPTNREVILLDQRRLPLEEHYDELRHVEEVAIAIETLAVRGAPAIGLAAAYGLVLAAARAEPGSFVEAMGKADSRLRRTRPTAVNLAWALDRMRGVVRSVESLSPPERLARLSEEARSIHREDVAACRAMGRFGAARVPDGSTVLTHCNAGALATGGYGTALGVIRAARESGKRVRVVACETRPVLQGARLTAWELPEDGFDVTLITDSMVGQLMRRRGVDFVVVGADRVARNGDVANKIGTYSVACLAGARGAVLCGCTVEHGRPRMRRRRRDSHRAANLPKWSRSVDSGRSRRGQVDNPAFDVTPAKLVRASSPSVAKPVPRARPPS